MGANRHMVYMDMWSMVKLNIHLHVGHIDMWIILTCGTYEQ